MSCTTWTRKWRRCDRIIVYVVDTSAQTAWSNGIQCSHVNVGDVNLFTTPTVKYLHLYHRKNQRNLLATTTFDIHVVLDAAVAMLQRFELTSSDISTVAIVAINLKTCQVPKVLPGRLETGLLQHIDQLIGVVGHVFRCGGHVGVTHCSL